VQIAVARTVEEAAAGAAEHIGDALGQAIAERGVATLALSGGASGAALLAALARQPLDWQVIHVYQVDERVAERGDPARNLTMLEHFLCDLGPLSAGRLHAMPVDAPDLQAAAAAYGRELEQQAGQPPVLDVVHLGLGSDGHTASLFPDDAALAVVDRSVVPLGPHGGYRRLTLTLPVLDAARLIVWFVTGAAKAQRLAELVAGGAAFPAGRVARARACVFADASAGQSLGSG
jgi:6-phosphogluconolactonase